MKKKGYVYGLFLVLLLCFGVGLAVSSDVRVQGAVTETAKQNGWVTEGGKKYYYINGAKAKGQQTIGGKRYYFNSVHGYMQTYWYTTSAGYTYYFGKDGVMRTGVQTIDSVQYYFKSTGRRAEDAIVTVKGQKYYYDKGGKLYKSGWLDYKDGKTYYFYRKDGHMLKSCWITSTENGKQYKRYIRATGERAEGWLKNSKGEYRYFLYRDGHMLTGWNNINKKRYYFDKSTGIRYKGLRTISGKKYYFNAVNGTMQTGWFKTTAGNYYYFGSDGVMRTGKQTIGSGQYYFNSSGRRVHNTIVTISGKKYYYDKNGKLYKGGWLDYKDGHSYYFYRTDGHMLKSCWISFTENGKTYKRYARSNGQRAEGWLKNSKGEYRYFLYRDGRMLTGPNHISKKLYYFDPSTGVRQTGKQKINSKFYYFASSGAAYKGQWVKKDGKIYYASSSGSLLLGWQTLSGSKYYFSKRYAFALTGYNYINKKLYYFYKSTGKMAANTWIDATHYMGSDGVWEEGKVNTSNVLTWPLKSWSYISSYFGGRDSPGGIGSTNHMGIDIAASSGTPIYAAASGTIVIRQYSSSAGYYIQISHGTINGVALETQYMHQSRFAPGLSVGSRVSKGQLIGYVGSTGNSTGPHLHFGVKKDGAYVDPLDYVKEPNH